MKNKAKISVFILFSIFILILSGCSEKTTKISEQSGSGNDQSELKKIDHVGQVPDEFKQIIEDNLFYNITSSNEKLLKADVISLNEEAHTFDYKVRMMDKYGKDLAVYSFTCDDAYNIDPMLATDDDGFLFILGFHDYSYDQNVWASDNSFSSRIIKCGKNGNVQFDTPLNSVEGEALRFCFEKDGKYYLFGSHEAPETKTRGVHTSTDVYAIVLDNEGTVVKNRIISGSDFDDLHHAEPCDNGFLLSVSSQSDDGDFAGSDSGGYPVDWTIKIDDDMKIIEKKKGSGRDYSDCLIGNKDGMPLYKSDPLLNGSDAGDPKAVIDYGDFYLVVSENATGVYKKAPPEINRVLYYTETVYSAYDKNGKLVFRSSVDSTPDY